MTSLATFSSRGRQGSPLSEGDALLGPLTDFFSDPPNDYTFLSVYEDDTGPRCAFQPDKFSDLLQNQVNYGSAQSAQLELYPAEIGRAHV